MWSYIFIVKYDGFDKSAQIWFVFSLKSEAPQNVKDFDVKTYSFIVFLICLSRKLP